LSKVGDNASRGLEPFSRSQIAEELFRLLTRAEFSDVQASSVTPTRFNNVLVICHIVQQPDTRVRVKLGTATPHDYSMRFIRSHHELMKPQSRQ
jgi:hypothetical protein